jgi:hypothetical protein
MPGEPLRRQIGFPSQAGRFIGAGRPPQIPAGPLRRYVGTRFARLRWPLCWGRSVTPDAWGTVETTNRVSVSSRPLYWGRSATPDTCGAVETICRNPVRSSPLAALLGPVTKHKSGFRRRPRCPVSNRSLYWGWWVTPCTSLCFIYRRDVINVKKSIIIHSSRARDLA